jgi:hypothetical protein
MPFLLTHALIVWAEPVEGSSSATETKNVTHIAIAICLRIEAFSLPKP